MTSTLTDSMMRSRTHLGLHSINDGDKDHGDMVEDPVRKVKIFDRYLA